MKIMIDSRFSRGQVIAASSNVRHVKNSPLWFVESQSVVGKFYHVVVREDGITCDCPDYELRDEVCKHIYSVIIMENEQQK